MTVKDVLTKRVTTCRPDTNLAAAIVLMWESDCGLLPVLTGIGELAGVLTGRAICVALGTRDEAPSDLTAREVMDTNPPTCRPTDEVGAAVATMRNAGINRLPVVTEGGRLEGIVSIADIVLSGCRFGKGRPRFAEVVGALNAIFSRSGQDRPAAA